MRSELVNNLPLTKQGMLLLRSLIESALSMDSIFSQLEISIPFISSDLTEIDLDCAVDNANLTFTQGVSAFEELYNLNLIAFELSSRKYCKVYTKNLLKFLKVALEDMSINGYVEDRQKDYEEVCSLLENIELKEAGSLPAVQIVKHFDEH